MPNLRLATLDDFPRLLFLSQCFHLESPYGHIPLDNNKVERAVLSFLVNDPDKICILLEDNGVVMGLVAGTVQEMLMCSKRVASEVVWYVYEPARKGTGGIRLRKAFEYWAHNIAKADYTHMASLNNEHSDKLKRHYEKKGYQLFEMTYLKDNNI